MSDLPVGQPLISIQLTDRRSSYRPGELLRGSFQIDAIEAHELHAVEVSVLWYTEGKGDEDLAVHHFERISADSVSPGALQEMRHFQTTLPVSPLSYEGVIVKICWCVRVRAFLKRGRNYVSEQDFRLGNVPVAETVAP